MTDETLIEELIEKLRGHIRWHVEADVLACDMTDRELRDIIVAGVLPIIQRREIEAGEKVKEACANGLTAYAEHYTAEKEKYKAAKKRTEARDFESMAMACAFRSTEIQALNVAAIVKEQGDD